VPDSFEVIEDGVTFVFKLPARNPFETGIMSGFPKLTMSYFGQKVSDYDLGIDDTNNFVEGGMIADKPAMMYQIGSTPVLEIYNIDVVSHSGGYSDYTEFEDTGIWYRAYPEVKVQVTCLFNKSFRELNNMAYLFTYIDDLGQESPPTDPTDFAIRHCGSETLINISEFDPFPANVQELRIYRTAITEESSVWKKVADISASVFATGTDENYHKHGDNIFYKDDVSDLYFVDRIPDKELGIELGPYGEPPLGIKHLVLHPCGSLIAAKGRSIYASHPFLPYVFPDGNKWIVDSDIVGLAIQGNDVIVLTKGHPNILSGSHPDNFAREELLINQSCVSKHSICKIMNSVFYASPDGLIQIDGANAKIVTDQVFSKRNWNDFVPSGMVAESYDGKLFAFFEDKDGFQFKAGVVTTFSDTSPCLFRDEEDDILYFVQDGAILEWQTHDDYRDATWQSKEFLFPRPVTFSDAQIISDFYNDIDLTFNAVGVTLTPINHLAFKLPIMRREMNWSFKLETNRPIDEFQIGTNARELRS